jgi:hypothetical protein
MFYALKRQILSRPNLSLCIAGLCAVVAAMMEWEVFQSTFSFYNSSSETPPPSPLDGAIIWCWDTAGETAISAMLKTITIARAAMMLIAPIRFAFFEPRTPNPDTPADPH